MRGNISPLHHRFYAAVLILLQSFGYAAVVFGTSRVFATVCSRTAQRIFTKLGSGKFY